MATMLGWAGSRCGWYRGGVATTPRVPSVSAENLWHTHVAMLIPLAALLIPLHP
jgi:hypothetical protein